MAELKSCLKEAKSAIKDKYYEDAIKHCKAALKLDKKNYMAMVMFGKSSQELKKYDESKKILMLASQVDSENPIAWQGLETLVEADSSLFQPEEQIIIYTRITSIVKEEVRINSVYRKIASIYCDKEQNDQAVESLYTLISKLETGKLINEVWKSIVQILSNLNEPSIEQTQKLIGALEMILNESVIGDNEGNYQLYLKLLHRTGQRMKLFKGAKSMALIFFTSYPLEWICRAFVEDYFYSYLQDCDPDIEPNEIDPYVEKLLEKSIKSRWGNLAQGCLLFIDGDVVEARQHLRIGAEGLSSNILAWLLLLNIQESSRDWSGVGSSCRRILPLLDNKQSLETIRLSESPGKFRQKILRRQAQSLCYMSHPNYLKKAIVILEEEPEKDLPTQILLIEARIKVKETQKAKLEIENLLENHGDNPQIQLLHAALISSTGQYEDAQNLLEKFIKNNPDSAQGMIELGKLYHHIGDRAKALVHCLKAAKLDPKNADSFLYLGHYYKQENNYDKARKCYEKCYGLNPLNDEVGASLSDTYRILGDNEANLKLLEKVTREAGRSSCGWAWLRLGLHHLDMRTFDEAVYMLQCAVQINIDDCVTLECLGDAYFERGSHTAALKVYNKVLEINPESLYPLCQIAMIEHITGELLDSRKDYEKVLEKKPPPSVLAVAQVGLGEVLLTSARQNLTQFFHSNVKEDCLTAIRALTNAASERSNSVSIWKLVGDCCTLLYSLPPSISTCDVPAQLVKSDISDSQEMIALSQLQVLQLGGKCYGLGLQLSEDNSLLWHNLGINLYLQGCHLHTSKVAESESTDVFRRALMSIKKSLALEPANPDTWNSLGIVASHQGVKDYKLAQHAFITSLENKPSASGWTHLGALYLLQDDAMLAHEAFSQAQALDPSFVSCWVGQALVAESIEHSDMFGLYRHTTLLGIQSEGCLGFGHQVTQDACDQNKQKDLRHITKISACIPVANDCLTFYNREKERDLVALNMCGLTLEMMGLNQSAIKTFIQADELIKDSCDIDLPNQLLDNVRCNYGRVLTTLGRVEEALTQYQMIKEPDIISQCGLALASLKAGKYEEAYTGYTSALHWLAEDDNKKSEMLVALAYLQYKFNNIEETKTLLFKSCHLQNAAVEGILALASLGLVTGDATLIGAALAELAPHADSLDYVHHVAFLRAAHRTVMGDHNEAKKILSCAIHKHPQNPSLWRYLSQHLLMFGKESPLLSSEGAIATAKAAIKLSQASSNKRDISSDVICSAMGHLLKYSSKNRFNEKCLKVAQRTVLMCPGSAEAWAMLVSNLKLKKDSKNVDSLAKIWSKKSKGNISTWLASI